MKNSRLTKTFTAIVKTYVMQCCPVISTVIEVKTLPSFTKQLLMIIRYQFTSLSVRKTDVKKIYTIH